MTFALIKAEMSQKFHQIGQMPRGANDIAAIIESRRKIIEDYTNHVEDSYLKYCDENIPIQRVTVISARLVIEKMKFLVQQQAHQHSVAEQRPIYTAELLTIACSILEMSLTLQSDDLLMGFSWYCRTFTQYHLLTYVLGHLCAMPDGPDVERAWNVVESSFRIIDNSDIPHESGSKWTILRLLKGKAILVRQSNIEINSLSLDSMEIPQDILNGSCSVSDSAVHDIVGPWLCTEDLDWTNGAGSFDTEDF
jgi:hypothetical protein